MLKGVLVKVEVQKLDDINLILSGEVNHSEIESNVQRLKIEAEKQKEETKKELKNEMREDKPIEEAEEAMVDDLLNGANKEEKLQRDAEGMVLQAFIEKGLEVAAIPVEDILGQPGFKKYENTQNGIYLEIQISTAPKIDTDIEYMSAVPTFTKPQASAAEVEAKLSELAQQQAPFVAIETPKAVENGDVVVIDFEGFIEDVAFEGGSAEKFNLRIGSNTFIPGFEAQLIGMVYGEQRNIEVTFPSDYSSPDLAGKQSIFKVKLHEIQEQKALAADDALAQKVLSDPKATLAQLRSKLADKVNAEALSTLYTETLKPELIKGLLAKFDFTLPNNVVEQEIDAKIAEKTQTMSQEQQKVYQTDKEKFHSLRESLRGEARDSIKTALIVDALAKKEGIDIDEQEILSALYYQAMVSGQDAQELVKYYKENNLMTSAKMGLTQDKLFGQMLGFDK